MPFTTLSLGLTLTIPTNGTRNWGTTLYNTTWTKISQHQHTGSGDGNKLATGSLNDNIVTTAKLSKNYGWTQAATLTPAGTTQTVDFNNGNVQVIDLSSATGTVTLTLSNPAQGSLYTILIVQGATPRDVVWPALCKWPQTVDPIHTLTASAVDMVTLYFNGTDYKGLWYKDLS